MPLPKFISNIFAGGASELVGKIGGIVDNLTLSKEEKESFKLDLFKATNEHTEKMASIAQAETDSYLKDVDSARQMQMEALRQDDKFSKRFTYYLATGVIMLTFIFDMCFFFVQYPERNHDIVNMIAGTLNSTGFAAIIYFFFGSSKSSQNKQDTIDALKTK